MESSTRVRRFVALHSAEGSPETWTLKIHRPELEDTGEYECQVGGFFFFFFFLVETSTMYK